MTITVNDAREEFTAAAGQTVFSYTFRIFSDTDLNVYVTPAGQVADDAADITTSYTVTGVGAEAGGTIVLSVGASAGDLVTIVSNIPSSRTTDYQTNGDFLPDTVNDDFDRVLSIVKKIEDTTNRAVVTAQSQQGPKPLSLPQPIPGKILRWNGSSDGLENVSPSDVPLDTVLTQDLTIIKTTIAAMTADADIVAGQLITVEDYATGSNSGVLLFKAVAGAASSPDGGSQIDHDTLAIHFVQNFPRVISVGMFGASASATAAANTTVIQACIDYAVPLGKDIQVPDIFDINTLNIDKVVDGNTAIATVPGDAIVDINGNDTYTRIFSSSGGGFNRTTAGDMFDTNLTNVVATSPVTQMVKFQNITFKSPTPANATYAISQKYLRVLFEGCNFRQMKCANYTTIHSQSIYFVSGRAARHTGFFFTSDVAAFDCSSMGLLIEAGTGGFDLTNAVGCRFWSTIEGQSDTALKINGSQGLSIQGYFEGNGTDIDLRTGDHLGVSLNGIFFSIATTHNVLWGRAIGCSSQGCYSASGPGIHDLSLLTSDSNVFINDISAGSDTTSALGYSKYVKPYIAVGLDSPSNSVIGASATFATSVMTVTVAPTSGAFAVGQYINSAKVPAHSRIASLGTGTGGTGTYNLDVAIPAPITVAQAVTVSNIAHFHGGKDTTMVLSDNGLGTGYGGAVQGRGLAGLGSELSLGVLTNGVFVERAKSNWGGGFGIGGSLATSATEGHFTIPSCAGAPTGVPNNVLSGTVAIQYDTTNDELYVYNGAWKSVALA